jgi:NAD(P) transhydrogenase subunit alpha
MRSLCGAHRRSSVKITPNVAVNCTANATTKATTNKESGTIMAEIRPIHRAVSRKAWATLTLALLMLLPGMLASSPLQAAEAAAPASLATSVEVAEAVQNGAENREAAHGAASKLDRRATLLASITIFALAVFLGFELINKVPPTLHTPLMSGSNAISGITVVGALLAAGNANSQWLVPLLGAIAVALAMINVVGGFLVTHRMLLMFRRK